MWSRSAVCLPLVVALLAGACGTEEEAGQWADIDDIVASVDAAPETTSGGSTTAGEGDSGSLDADTTTVAPSRWPAALAELDPEAPVRWTVEVLERRPHDTGAYTQGLELLDDGTLLESTGLRGESSIRIVDPDDGSTLTSMPLEADEFGEGATVVDGTVVQLTWREERARRWSLPDLEPLPSWDYAGEGWGLCLLDDRLVMSDGTPTLTFRDPEDFSVLARVDVTYGGAEVARLNELECVDGHIVANIWQSPTVVVIRPDGRAVASIDATPLTAEIAAERPNVEVLNGIAVRDDESLWMAGKLWPTLFAVRVVPVA